MAVRSVPASIQASIESTKVTYAQLGASGLRVSVPILGTMSLGTKAWQDWVVDEEEALQVLKAAWDRGNIIQRCTRICSASNFGRRDQHLGYSQHVFERSKRGDHRKGHQDFQYSPPQASPNDQVLSYCW